MQLALGDPNLYPSNVSLSVVLHHSRKNSLKREKYMHINKRKNEESDTQAIPTVTYCICTPPVSIIFCDGRTRIVCNHKVDITRSHTHILSI